MILAVIGSRNCPPVNVAEFLDFVPTGVVSGGARGADTCGADYAKAHNIPLTEFLPDYKRYGKSAPLKRNAQIVDFCDQILAFWDGMSHGTAYTIKLAQKAKKPVKIVNINAF